MKIPTIQYIHWNQSINDLKLLTSYIHDEKKFICFCFVFEATNQIRCVFLCASEPWLRDINNWHISVFALYRARKILRFVNIQ